MSERLRETTCQGVVDFYHPGVKPSKHEIILLKNVDPVNVILSETAQGVIKIECPYLEGKTCERVKEVPYFDGLNPVGPVCKFVPAGSYESYEVYESAFDPPHFYQKVWDQLTPEAKSAAILMSPTAFGGMEKLAFEGMCLSFQLSKNPSELIDQLVENGVVEELSRLGALEAALGQLGNGTYEDMELKAEGEVAVASYKRSILNEINEYNHPTPGRFNEYGDLMEPEVLQRMIEEETTGWDKPDTHLRFSPGFQTFVDQFHSKYGFPINFTRPRDPETYINEDGRECLKY